MQRNSSGPTIAIVLACALAACDERITAPADEAATSLETVAALGAAPAARSMIVFDSNRSGNRDLWAMAPDGSGLRRLTDHPGFDVLADVSRDGRSIVFQSDREAPFAFRVYVMDADGSNLRRLTAVEAFEASPDWSPDGRRVAFDRGVGPGNQEVFVIGADGTGEVRLTESPGFDGQPHWSPDGRRLAFSSHRNGNREIYVMNADGSDQRRLTNDPGADEAPAWSPDGRRIAFHSTRGGGLGLYVMDADGTGVRRVADEGFSDASPAWSPDGRWLAFHRRVTPANAEVHIVRADGLTQAVRLTEEPGFDGFVDWTRRLGR